MWTAFWGGRSQKRSVSRLFIQSDAHIQSDTVTVYLLRRCGDPLTTLLRLDPNRLLISDL